ncbi:hypothetical protein Desgi_2395 [Desulfoscipio gibsoniae DSM 7213]|uniref:Uncharacterized protein n=1 Tax=Desulfoscipio gibsoniae DSM 7213 TaxID=767817 RepID=R4KGS6_9FIRM|nr:hypothetical protein Desgi_2395 [Desulfoscipio gibsoniae DSM 7213]
MDHVGFTYRLIAPILFCNLLTVASVKTAVRRQLYLPTGTRGILILDYLALLAALAM